jgi:NADH-quinone oxidoreductase subunit N
VVKVGLFLFFLRVVYNVFSNVIFTLQPLFIFVAVGSMLVGTFGALKQVKVKRFIAYASISQVGFIMLGVASCSLIGFISALMYLFLYAVMSLAFFTLLLNTEHATKKTPVIYLSELYCLSLYSSNAAKYLAAILFSMAGIPPLGGFICKLLVYLAAMDAKLDVAVLFSLLLSIISTYYYLNFIHYIWFVKFNSLRLYYFKSDFSLNIFLEAIVFFLIGFMILSPLLLRVTTNLAISCLWPIYFY